MRQLAFLMLCVVGSGCGPRLVFWGHDPLRLHRLEVIQQGSEQFVRFAGKEQAHYRSIGIAGLAMSEDGRHLAYPAQRRGVWLVVRDTREEASWEGVGPLKWSPDGQHLAYPARHGRTWQVVIDGQAGPPWERILAGTLTLSSDGAHHVYVATRGKTAQVVHDGRAGAEYDGISRLTLSSQGTHLSYLGRRQASAYVSCDGVQSGPYQMVAELLQDPAGDCAFIAKRDFRWRVFAGGQELGAYDSAAGLTQSSTGELAYVARQGSKELVLRRGVPDSPYLKVDWQSLSYSTDGRHFAYVARTSTGALVVHDGVPGPQFADVQGLYLRGEHLGYVAALFSGGSRVVEDGRLGPVYAEIADLQPSPDGTRTAYLAQGRGLSVVVTPQGERTFPLILPGTLAWSRDGQRWGCLAGADLRTLQVIIDGQPQHTFAMTEYYQTLLRGDPGFPSDNSSILRTWISAELERPLGSAASLP